MFAISSCSTMLLKYGPGAYLEYSSTLLVVQENKVLIVHGHLTISRGQYVKKKKNKNQKKKKKQKPKNKKQNKTTTTTKHKKQNKNKQTNRKQKQKNQKKKKNHYAIKKLQESGKSGFILFGHFSDISFITLLFYFPIMFLFICLFIYLYVFINFGLNLITGEMETVTKAAGTSRAGPKPKLEPTRHKDMFLGFATTKGEDLMNNCLTCVFISFYFVPCFIYLFVCLFVVSGYKRTSRLILCGFCSLGKLSLSNKK